MSFLIRPATSLDTEAIANFQLEMAWETERLRLDLPTVLAGVAAVFENSNRGRYFVCERDGGVVASLLITYEWSDWRNSNMWYIQSVYVAEDHRRQGIFRKMYAHVRAEAKTAGVKYIRLYVETENERAQSTYQQMGMKKLHYFMYGEELS